MMNKSINHITHDTNMVSQIIEQAGTPVYVYNLSHALDNYQRIQSAFSQLDAHVHYSAKANGNLTILKALINAGAGIDAVSAGEIHRALTAGAKAVDIVFAGVGKSREEIDYAINKGVGWFNVENVAELDHINEAAIHHNQKVALRLNPDVTANTHPHIATGHGGAKFGLTAEVIKQILANQSQYPHINFAGIHVHIGSQLHDTIATQAAIKAALTIIEPYPAIRTVNIGGGLPVAYSPDEIIPSYTDFAEAISPLLKDYQILLEPGRSIIADAGILITTILYVKKQAGQTFYIVDASMSELIRPALYNAHHEIVPLEAAEGELQSVNIVGPVCETTDVLGKNVMLPEMQVGDRLAILTAGAYGMVMASNYNARPRPAEITIKDGQWKIARKKETWFDLVQHEISD